MSSLYKVLLAWMVHLFTASGLLVAFLALLAIDNQRWAEAYLWLCVCLVIDGVDGTLARKFHVSEVLPHMDGKSIDYVVDFVSYLIVPAFFFYKAQMVSTEWMIPALSVILLSSALYYGKKEMVADDQYFVGFPVLWNIVVFYQFFIFGNHQYLNLTMIIVFGLMHFAPIRFAYPSRSKRFALSHILVSIVGVSATVIVLFSFPSSYVWAKWLTVIAAIYFLLFVIVDTWFMPQNK